MAARKDAAKQTGGALVQLPVRLALGHKKVQLHDSDVDLQGTHLKARRQLQSRDCASADIKNFSVRE